MNRIYVISRCDRLAMMHGDIDPDSFVAGPYTAVEDAEAELQRRERDTERKGTVRAVAWAVALVVLCGWGLPGLISDERLEARGVAVGEQR